ncbi:aminotransferase class III-fold pyridoxal phosphate-dependent enzyme [Xenorhabdus sp. Vera]|uniref:aminotransferase class III-fold pyridoxal phosphate-dependent enzyme n=1 Tax=Xenorhabdus koppenhoeferi TaxID=351659 RepID=UPI00198AB438|nr:aminotransferase class III-fold pyridoxal phosphate-dependent enzyme [Xenorhabdus sp. Vera]MBD2810233.1 aminotransferase class III-fold pyridoxal phosphate-dependent enzyme [Xenorhabdus sp. Vera]
MTQLPNEIKHSLQSWLQSELASEHVPTDTDFLAMGIESLTLIRLKNNIKSQYGIDIGIGNFFKGLSNLNKVADFISSQAQPIEVDHANDKPPTVFTPAPKLQAQTQTMVISEHDITPSAISLSPALAPATIMSDEQSIIRHEVDPIIENTPNIEYTSGVGNRSGSEIKQSIMVSQLNAMQQLFQQQLAVLQNLGGGNPVIAVDSVVQTKKVLSESSIQPSTQQQAPVSIDELAVLPEQSPSAVSKPSTSSGEQITSGEKAKFTYKPVEVSVSEPNDAETTAFIQQYNAKTSVSKATVQKYRKVLCDNRHSIQFNSKIKELCYPIVGKTAKGAHFTDLNGNIFIDIAMGFGVNFFGHNPDFIQGALQKRLQRGFHLGPIDESAMVVADLISEITGVERVSFTNSGTEAIMLACRVARAASGKRKIVIFNNAYHGHYTEILFMGGMKQDDIYPQSSGIPETLGRDIVVLNYGEQQSLDYIAAHGNEIAMVMVEPVQSRNINLRPKSFIQSLRKITAQQNVVLLFDEIITGFRYHPEGAQHYYQIKADLVTYGKVIGGGMPIGVLAGNAAIMDYLDGGFWQFGDTSYPPNETTFFAGTFCKHPLAMAAAEATLLRMKATGSALQTDLNDRTSGFVERLNALFTAANCGIEVANFGSLFKFRQKKTHELFFHHLLMNGVYTWEGRTCFLSTAHDDSVLNACFDAFEKSVETISGKPRLLNVSTESDATTEVKASIITLPEFKLQKNLAMSSWYDPAASRSYNEFVQLVITDGLDLHRFNSTIEYLFNRHQQLHQVFCPETFRTVAGQFDHHAVIHTETASIDSPEQFLQWRQTCLDEEFRLDCGPMFRVHIAQIDLSRSVWDKACLASYVLKHHRVDMIFLIAHHTIVDGISLDVLIDELAAVYHGNRDLPPAMQYDEYLGRLAAFKKTPAFIHQKSFWHKYLSGWQTDLANLPAPDPAVLTGEEEVLATGGFHLEKLPPELTSEILAYATKQRVTPYMLMYTVYSIFLGTVLKQSQFVMSTSVSGRNFDNFDNLVGLTTGMLPVRVNTRRDEQHFSEYLDLTCEQLLDIFSNQDITVDDLTIQNCSLGYRSDKVTRYLNYDFNFSPRKLKLNDSGSWFLLLDNPKRYIVGQLSLDVFHSEHDLYLHWEYAAQAYSKEQIKTLSGKLIQLLHYLINSPESDTLTLADIIVYLNSLDTPSIAIGPLRKDLLYRAPIHALFEERVVDAPQACALIDVSLKAGERQLSFAELNRQANALAHSLLNQGLQPEEPVFVSVRRGIPLAVSVLAVLKAGGVYVPVDKKLPDTQIEFLLSELNPRFALIDGDYGALNDGNEVRNDTLVSLLKALSHVRSFNFYDEETLLRQCGVAEKNSTLLQNLGKEIPAGQTAYITCTSGSTQKANCVMNSHGAIAHHCLMMKEYLDIGPEDRMLQFTDLCWDIVLEELFPVWVAGGRVVFSGDTPPDTFADFNQLLIEQQVSLADLPSTYWQGWVDSLADPAMDYPSHLRRILVGTEKVDPQTLKKWQQCVPEGVIFSNAYAQTETTITATDSVVMTDTPIGETVPLGKPLPNTGFYVLDESGHPVTRGEPGELYIGGPLVTKGYFGNDALTAAKYMADPYIPVEVCHHAAPLMYKTGDLVSMDEQGNLSFLGRTDFQIKVRGYRIEPTQLESAIAQWEGIEQVVLTTNCVIDVSIPVADTKLLCYVKTQADKAEQKTLSERIRRFISEHFAHYMQPHAIVYLPEFPKTANGKVSIKQFPLPGHISKKHSLLSYGGNHVEQPSSPVDLNSSAGRLLLAHLGQRELDMNDSFIALGGDSLTAIKILSALQKEHGITLKLPEFMAYSTLADLIGCIESVLMTNRETPASVVPDSHISSEKREERPVLQARRRKKKGMAE